MRTKTATLKQDQYPEPKEGDLRVWWIPQIPHDCFYVPVESVEQAALICKVLAEYDKFQLKYKIKGDYSNTGGLQMFEDGEWFDYCNEFGDDFENVMDAMQESGKLNLPDFFIDITGM